MRLTAPHPMVSTTSRTGAPRRCFAASAATRVTTTESMRSMRTASVDAVAYDWGEVSSGGCSSV